MWKALGSWWISHWWTGIVWFCTNCTHVVVHVDCWVGGWCTGRYQLRSQAHLNPAIRRRTLGDTLSFGLHSSTLGNFLKFLLASLSTFTLFDNLYCLCVGVDNVFKKAPSFVYRREKA